MPSMMLQYFVHKNVLRFYDGKKINLKKKKSYTTNRLF